MRINKNNNMGRGSRREIPERTLTYIMMAVVLLAMVSVIICIFVAGKSFSNNNKMTDNISETPSEPDFSESDDHGFVTDTPSDSGSLPLPSQSDTEISTGTASPDTSETDNDTIITSPEHSDTVTTEASESETPNEPNPEPSYVPVTPDNVKVINKGEIESNFAILVDCSSNTSIAQRLADQRIYPASMTKIMTIVLVCEYASDLEDKIVVTRESIYQAYIQEASRAGFKENDVVTIRDLLYGAALPSGAEATYLLAGYIAGSEEAFAALMNQKAAELKMTGTHFINASGLHDSNHYSTVRDIATLLNYAMQNKTVKEIMSSVSYTTTTGLKLYSTVFNKTGYAHATYSNGLTMIAGKTGYTPEAMQCLATYYEDADKNGYILVTAYSTTGKYSTANDAKILIEKYIK